MLKTLALVAGLLGPGGDPPPIAVPTPGSDPGSPSADDSEYRGVDLELEVAVPRIEEADISVDGRLDEPAWARAALLTGFTQYEPVEGRPADEETEVRVFYASDAIYFGVRAFDSRPDLVEANMGERDRSIFNDDWFRVVLDTYNDRRQAYVFYVNPLGIQTDGLWIEGLEGRGVPIDFNPDFIWDSHGQVTEDGWVAEIRIPYVSIRFNEVPVQSWGLNMAREVRRSGFKQSWAPLTRNVSSTLMQSGQLVGLSDLEPRRLIEVTPVATGKSTGLRTDDGAYVRDGFQPEAGVDLRYGITQNLVLDATVNPDFSQVEADADQITVNERFDLYIPEKRPFFLDGAETFRTPSELVYTRRIVAPSAGGKLTGKAGSFAIGYLGALDDSPVSLGGETHRDLFNIVRVRRDVGAGSNLGLLYTDRTATGGGQFNRVLAGDARILFGGRYTITGQYARSWQDATSPFTVGGLASLRIQRSGRNLGLDLQLEDIAPGFRADAGFIRRTGDTRMSGRLELNRYGAAGAFVERYGVSLSAESFTDHHDFWAGRSFYEGELEAHPQISFRGGWSFTTVFRSGYYRFRQEDYRGLRVVDPEGALRPFRVPGALENMKAIGLMPRLRLSGSANLRGRVFYREVPIYGEASRGLELQLGPELTFRPTSQLELSGEYTYSRIQRTDDGSRFSRTNISRLKAQYQFTRSLLVRGIGQYSLRERDALRDPRTGQVLHDESGLPLAPVDLGAFQGQVLVSYEPSPGTIFYAGYSRVMEGARTYALSRMDPMSDGLFVKVSYRFRM